MSIELRLPPNLIKYVSKDEFDEEVDVRAGGMLVLFRIAYRNMPLHHESRWWIRTVIDILEKEHIDWVLSVESELD